MIFRAQPYNSGDLARLHRTHISSGFLSSLGDSFLEKLYSFLISKETVYVYSEEDEVKGFISCAGNTGRLYKSFLLSNKIFLLLFLIKKIFSFSFYKKILETLAAPSKSHTNTATDIPELLSIVVDNNVQSKGIGKELLNTLETELISKNIKELKVIAGKELKKANAFYLKNGFVLVKEIYIHGDSGSNVYIKKLAG